MHVIVSAMAFSVVIIVLSTIVTGIVELLLRVFGLRERTLRKTVGSLFENVVWPRLGPHLTTATIAAGNGGDPNIATADAKAAARDNFVESMTVNSAFISQPAYEKTKGGWRRLIRLLNLAHKDSVDTLTPLAFAERLARTDVGKAILAEDRQELEPLVQDFVRTFDRYGRAASEAFRKNAKMVAMVVGVLFALIANFDAGRLFSALMNNPDLRTNLIEAADDVAKSNEQTAKTLRAIVNQLEAGSLTEDQAKSIEKRIAEIEAGVGALKNKGLPIGQSFYPYCNEGPEGDALCQNDEDSLTRAVKAVTWGFFTVLAGVLIGLGGPFWFRVFSGLSQIFQVLRSAGFGGEPKHAKPEEVDASPSAVESVKPKDVLDAFKVAAHVHAASS